MSLDRSTSKTSSKQWSATGSCRRATFLPLSLEVKSCRIEIWIDEHRLFYQVLCIWMFPKIGVAQNGWFIMENPNKNGWFGGTTIFGNIHMVKNQFDSHFDMIFLPRTFLDCYETHTSGEFPHRVHGQKLEAAVPGLSAHWSWAPCRWKGRRDTQGTLPVRTD